MGDLFGCLPAGLSCRRAAAPPAHSSVSLPPPLSLSSEDLYGIFRALRLTTLGDEKSLFVRCVERPIRDRDPRGLKRLQVG